jgi:hypothetical protein
VNEAPFFVASLPNQRRVGNYSDRPGVPHGNNKVVELRRTPTSGYQDCENQKSQAPRHGIYYKAPAA